MIQSLKITIVIAEAIFLVMSCSDSDPITAPPCPETEDLVYAELTAKAHLFDRAGAPGASARDSLIVHIDARYAPDMPIIPLLGLQVSCNADVLAWSLQVLYYVGQPRLIIHNGGVQTFTIAETPYLPELIDSIFAPGQRMNLISPNRGATIDRATDLTITWVGSGSGKVVIEFKNSNYEVVSSFETEDDESHVIAAEDLAGLNAGAGYLYVYRYNKKTISSEGYDPRSWIRAVSGLEFDINVI